MTRVLSGSLVFLAILALGTAALAQPPGGGFRGGFMGDFGGMAAQLVDGTAVRVLSSPTVQKELNLTGDQQEKVKEIVSKGQAAMQEAMAGMRDLSPEERREKMPEMAKKMQAQSAEQKKAIDAVLQPNQASRLREIAIQVMGVRALADPTVQDAVGLSEDQKGKLKSIATEQGQKMRDLMQGGFDREKMQEMQKETQTATAAVLTPEQKTKFEAMQGAKVEIPPGELMGGMRGKRGG